MIKLLATLLLIPTVYAAQVTNLVDESTNQPKYITVLTPYGGSFYPVPDGFTCTYNWGTHCAASTGVSAGDNVLKAFLSVNNTTPLEPGTYTIIRETIGQCANGESLDDCKARGNDWEEFTIGEPPPTPAYTGTSAMEFTLIILGILSMVIILPILGRKFGKMLGSMPYGRV